MLCVDPRDLKELIDEGRAQFPADFVSDSDCEDGEGFGDHEAEIKSAYDSDNGYFGDFAGVASGNSDADDPHENILRNLGELDRGGKRWV